MAIKTINDTHLTSIANAIRNKYIESGVDIMDDNGEAPKYKPSEMATAIGNLPSVSVKPVIAPLNVTENGEYVAPSTIDGYSPVTVNVPTGGAELPSEALTISGNCSYRFSFSGWDWFIENYGDQITTSNITSATNMFYYSKIETIPFTINLSTNANGCSCISMFESCSNLKTLPEISGKPNSFSSVFSNCYSIRQIPDSWGNLDFSKIQADSFININDIFNSCYSLRQIPASLISKLHNKKTTGSYSKLYYTCFSSCYSLDEILNLPVDGATMTSNMFASSFDNCSRLKDMTFATNNGTPYTANWKTQTIDLTKSVGNSSNSYVNNILNYNSGITADKKVTDDTTYQALKNDPDWFTTNVAYSRYNHDSAVATINSLPDTSAYLAANGGTNTIKFRGNSGSATDGGAINTLTEEEIAVATAKGWTVTLV